MKITDILDFNPRTNLPKNKDLPFIEMANLPIAGRDIPNIQMRPATGSGSKFANGDTILARITPCLENGKGGMIRNLPKEGIGHGSTEFIVMRAKRPSDQNFVYYLSRLPEFREFAIKQMTGTSGRQRVSWQALEAFDIPEIKEKQREKIGMFLSKIDDKIELNQQMNETLESMAQAIFQDWLIDFGPTRRKMEGTTDPNVILGGLFSREKTFFLVDLFPSMLNNSDLPQGWKKKSLDEIAIFLNGLALQKYPAENKINNLPVIKIAELRNGITAKTDYAVSDIPEKYIINDGDFILSWSGSLLAKFWTQGKGSLNQHLFKVSSEEYPVWFYTHCVLMHLADFQRIADSKATTMGHIQRRHLKSATVSCPPKKILYFMGEIMSPFIQKIIANHIESRILSDIRDTVLPKLISGGINMTNIEKEHFEK